MDLKHTHKGIMNQLPKLFQHQ